MSNQNNNQNDNNQNNNDNNFFNDNPLFAFIIFSVVIIILFKSFAGEGSSELSEIMGNPKITHTQRVKYSDIKKFIKEGKVSSVKITSNTIEAIDKSGTTKFVAGNVPAL